MKYNTLGWENIEHNVQENKEELINLFELLNELGSSVIKSVALILILLVVAYNSPTFGFTLSMFSTCVCVISPSLNPSVSLIYIISLYDVSIWLSLFSHSSLFKCVFIVNGV